MFDTNAIARAHFTKKVDGQSSYRTFVRSIGLENENLPFEYDGDTLVGGRKIHFVCESWGGFTNASGEWTVFISWRSTRGGVTQYIHWTWNPDTKSVFNRRNYSFVS